MCTQVYIGADRPLPTMTSEPSSRWAEPPAPAFVVRPADEDPDERDAVTRVRRQLLRPYLYCVGSFMGCGCGFGYWPLEEQRKTTPALDEDAIATDRANRESTHALAAYLDEVTRDGPVDVLFTWLGKEDQPPQKHITVEPGAFRAEWVVLFPHTGHLVTVVSPAQQEMLTKLT